jgi:hypothetical protein
MADVKLALRRMAAHIALLAFTGVIVLTAVDGHSGFDDDRACGDRGLHVAAYAAAVVPAIPLGPPQHCALCHLTRAASGASPALPVATPSLDAVAAALTDWVVAPARGQLTEQSSRAPPAGTLV